MTCACDDPEGPHQIRVGLRRLRTALSVFGRGRTAAALAREARDIGAEVGRLRDLDVVRLEIVRPFVLSHPTATGFAALDRALADAGTAAREDLRDMLESDRLDRLLADTQAWAKRHTNDPATALADKALRKRFRKARRQGAAFRDLTTEERHAFRKELKKLRYTLDCGAWAEGKKARKTFLKRLKAIQESLGAMNDAVVAQEVLMRVSFCAGMAERAAAGQILAALSQRSTADLTRTAGLWAKVDAARPGWV